MARTAQTQGVSRMQSPKKPFHEAVAEKLIEQLKVGVAPWQKPWGPGEAGAVMPINPTTGKRYKGINAIQLMSQGHSDQRWLTYKQAASVDAQVRKGEKGTPIQYWKFSEEQIQTDGNAKPVLDVKGEPLKHDVKLERPRVFFATVFNAEQIDGLQALPPRQEQAWTAVERAEQILQACGAVIHHSEQNRAFYRPATDSIHLPGKDQFPSADNYYATALHELGHWTGLASRLDRDLAHPFGSDGYAKEELRAEIASMILGDELGIGHDPGQHAAYVGSWIKALQDDPLEIFRAAADAEKIQAYVLGLAQKQVQEQVHAQTSEKTQEDTMQQQHNLDNLPGRLVDRLVASGVMPRLDAQVASAWRDLHTSTDATRAIDTEAFNEASQNAFGWTFSSDWSGGVQVQGSVTEHFDGQPHVTPAEAVGLSAAFWSVYAQEASGLHQWLANFPARQEADAMAERLALIVAHSQTSRYDKAAMLARIVEERVRRDPSSTGEDISAAKEARKNAEFVATYNDEDLQQRIVAIEHGRLQQAAVAAPQLLSSADFARVASAVPLVNHGRRWEVWVGEQSFGFADAPTPAGAVQEAHKREVNNALYSRSVQNTGVVAVQAMPPEQVLGEYPDLRARFADTVSFQQTEQQTPNAALLEKTFIDVPFTQKDDAKALGAKWDRQAQCWYVPANVDSAAFAQWQQAATAAATSAPSAVPASPQTLAQAQGHGPADKRHYLAVPYGERGAAKAAGALWDKAAKSWYAGPQADHLALERWALEKALGQQGPAMAPQEEFALALRSLGCAVEGQHPVMDGATHRIEVLGDRKGEQAGFYVGHLDGHPAGYIKNNKTGLEMKWKSKGYTLDPAQKAQLQAEAAAKLQVREAEHAQRQEEAAQRVSGQMATLVPVKQPTAYMLAKGIAPQAGVSTDQEGLTLYVPATDANGKQWTMQYILEDGTKRFAKDSRKEGCFHAVGGMEALAKAPALVIGEGYATAGSLSQSLGFATVAAFDAGNLPHVAKALHEKFPDKPIIIAGDDDKHLEATQGVNPGRTKAELAASAVGGKVLLPIFAPGEQAANPKGFTDFNDLANKSVLGTEGIERQVRSLVNSVIEKHQAQMTQQQQEQERKGVALGEQAQCKSARMG
ncbi:MAG: zincin-like metallopeptidase domain-containing protein [Burkholderiaceae bacterium]|nr:zincin-like metallopeptidase domain-containing protein [Burkholderiaceae bacterium]